MSAKPLKKLEELADKRASVSGERLRQEAQQLEQIMHHCNELQAINLEYQKPSVEGDGVSPTLLAHRRAFVENLTGKLEKLKQQGEIKKRSVKVKEREHNLRTAQHAAIEIINDQRSLSINAAQNHRNQKQMDEIARGQHFERNRHETEQDND